MKVLVGNSEATIDDEDADLVLRFRWGLGPYAITVDGGRTVYMHRLVLGLSPGDGIEVDHLNHDPLDNRKANLRTGTHAENMYNRRGNSTGSSWHRGVSFDSERKCWMARAQKDGRNVFLGRFDDEAQAAAAVEAFWSRVIA